MSWTPAFTLYLNRSLPRIAPLFKGLRDASSPSPIVWTGKNVFLLNIYLMNPPPGGGGIPSPACLADGYSLVMAGSAGGAVLFQTSSFTKLNDIEGNAYYQGTLNLNTDAMALALAAAGDNPISVSVEVDVINGDTSELSLPFNALIRQPVYGATPAPTAITAVGSQLTLPNVTQIPSNGSTGLGDVPVVPFKDLGDFALLCPDALDGGETKSKQFWYVKNTTEDDESGQIQSGPDFDAELNPYKWARAL